MSNKCPVLYIFMDEFCRVQQLFDTADKMYILPPHRVTVYIMGLFTGYILRKYNNVVLTKVIMCSVLKKKLQKFDFFRHKFA